MEAIWWQRYCGKNPWRYQRHTKKMTYRPVFLHLSSLRCARCCDSLMVCAEKHSWSNELSEPLCGRSWAICSGWIALNFHVCVSTPDTKPLVRSTSEEFIISPLEETRSREREAATPAWADQHNLQAKETPRGYCLQSIKSTRCSIYHFYI